MLALVLAGCASTGGKANTTVEHATQNISNPLTNDNLQNASLFNDSCPAYSEPSARPDINITCFSKGFQITHRYPPNGSCLYSAFDDNTKVSYYIERVEEENGTYSLLFDGYTGGIPVCAVPLNGTDFAACSVLSPQDREYQELTASHQVSIFFLDEYWSIDELTPPETRISALGTVNGGELRLGRKAESGRIFLGTGIRHSNLQFMLEDIQATGYSTLATISMKDADGNILIKDKLAPGQTREFIADNSSYLFHIYRLTCGYTFGGGSKVADAAILNEEITLKDGATTFIGDKTCNVTLSWTNFGASEQDTQPDSLKSIILNCSQ